MPISIGHYLQNMPMLASQWNEYNYTEPNRQRIYLKDIDTPQLWHDKLKEQIPKTLFYLNDGTGDIGGPGSVDEPNPNGLGTKRGRGIARTGDLMSCLPPMMRADNMQCYIGHEGTYTPAHREMCATLGQNIMVETSGTVGEDGKPTKPGSSIWFMTETKDRHLVSEYWLSTLGHDIEVESHFAQINAWKRAPFQVYIVEQKVGDFILIPPLAPHQVWNRGTRTMKAAWNRTTVETLEMAINEALPRARMVCRDEQYKCKAIVLFSLQRYSGHLNQVAMQKDAAPDPQALLALTESPKVRQLQKDFKRLFKLYTQILLSEMFSLSTTEKNVEYLPYDSNVTCSYCRCNIFNRFLTCNTCVIPLENGEEDKYDICMECYAMGRSCHCISKLTWVEQFLFGDLVEKHDLWRSQIIRFEGDLLESSPLSLDSERATLRKKTLAEICQEQLKARPWRDPTKEPVKEVEQADVEDDATNADGTPKKKKKVRRSEKWMRENLACHICRSRDPLWKLAICKCGTPYCYGSLWRGFDIMPHAVMEDRDWQCPRCLKMCTCSVCRKDPRNTPFEPNGTVLGHDTKKIADPRSVESLVDFSHSNMHWVTKAGDIDPFETRRLKRRQEEAAQAKSSDPLLSEHYVVDDAATAAGAATAANLSPNQRENTPKTGNSLLTRTPFANLHPRPSPIANARSAPAAAKKSRPANRPKAKPTDTSMIDPILLADDSIRKAASDALKHMEDLSQLEQDPEAFRIIAGLSSGGSGPNHFVAPGASVAFQNGRSIINLTPNKIMYEYPDPMSSQNTTPNLLQHPAASASCNDVKKRKRASHRPVLQSDFETPKKDSNQQYKEAQLLKTMTEAKKSDRFISAQAAVEGKSLVVTLRIESQQLARLNGRNRNVALLANTDQVIAGNIEEPVVILESDLPVDLPAAPEFKKAAPKRKWAREEVDEDFSTRKTRERKSFGPLKPFIKRTTVTQVEEASESEEGVDEIHRLAAGTDGLTPKERRLPAYLARRSPADTSELPKELAEPVARRRSLPKRSKVQEGSSTIRNGGSNRDHNISDVNSSDAPPERLSRNISSAPQRQVVQSKSEKIAAHKDSSAERHIQPTEQSLTGIGQSTSTVPQAKLAASSPKTDNRKPSKKQLDSAEANRRAKLRAMAGDQDTSDYSGSESEPDSES
jgi:hypothetical protein